MFSNEFIKEVQNILKDDYKKDISHEEATKIARHIVVLFDLLAKNSKQKISGQVQIKTFLRKTGEDAQAEVYGAEFEEIKRMTYELKEKIESYFLLEYNELVVAEIKALRQCLEDKGFIVMIDYNVDVVTTKLTADVSLWWPKDVN